MNFTQKDWTPGSTMRQGLFKHVTDTLNAHCGKVEFVVQDDVCGLVRHTPTNVRIGLRPSLPANPLKPFDIWVRGNHRFPMKADGGFNVGLVVRRVKEVKQLRAPVP